MFNWFNRNSKRHKQLLKLADQIKEFVEIDKAAEKLQATINKPFVDTVVEEKEVIKSDYYFRKKTIKVPEINLRKFKKEASEVIEGAIELNNIIPKEDSNKIHHLQSMGMQVYHPHKYISYE